MFSDTHFHFKLTGQEFGVDVVEVLREMAQNDCFFALDVGTKANDLSERVDFCEKTLLKISDFDVKKKASDFLYFSAGIWPDLDSIRDAENQIKILKQNILAFNGENSKSQNENKIALRKKVIAVGEGGLDHHWNPNGADRRSESDFDKKTYEREKKLFEMQLDLAKELNLPFIIHSRDAFEDTLACVKNVGYHNGVVHCFSYGIREARAFLDLGWHVAVGGGATYVKKSKTAQMQELLNFIPEDRFLCETDSPYLTPVPLRGTPNSPANVRYVYDFIAKMKGVPVEKLSSVVDKNIKKLFKIGG